MFHAYNFCLYSKVTLAVGAFVTAFKQLIKEIKQFVKSSEDGSCLEMRWHTLNSCLAFKCGCWLECHHLFNNR